MMRKILYILAVLFFTGCGNSTDSTIKDIDYITIDTTSPTSIYATENKKQLTSTTVYTDGTSSDSTQNVKWTSSDYSKMAVYQGEINPKVNGGSVDISISYGKLPSSKIKNSPVTLTIHAVTSLSMDKNGSNVTTTGTQTIIATATYDDSSVKTIGAGNSLNISWSVSGNATLDSVTDGVATVTFNSGQSTVTVSAFDGNVTKTETFNIP